MLREVFEILSRLTGIKAPAIEVAATRRFSLWPISINGSPTSQAIRRVFRWKG